MTADEFETELADASHTLAKVHATDRGKTSEEVHHITLELSNGTTISIEPSSDISGNLWLQIT